MKYDFVRTTAKPLFGAGSGTTGGFGGFGQTVAA